MTFSCYFIKRGLVQLVSQSSQMIMVSYFFLSFSDLWGWCSDTDVGSCPYTIPCIGTFRYCYCLSFSIFLSLLWYISFVLWNIPLHLYTYICAWIVCSCLVIRIHLFLCSLLFLDLFVFLVFTYTRNSIYIYFVSSYSDFRTWHLFSILEWSRTLGLFLLDREILLLVRKEMHTCLWWPAIHVPRCMCIVSTVGCVPCISLSLTEYFSGRARGSD